MNKLTGYLLTISFFLSLSVTAPAMAARHSKPVVVLSFDDATLSHFTFVAPLLKKAHFGATFYICEYPGFEDKTKYMTWEQIGAISRMGFEIGNHGRTHKHVNRMRTEELNAELQYIEAQCSAYDIPRPATYAYPGYDYNDMAQEVLQQRGYTSARTGGEHALKPDADTNTLLLPSYTISGDSLDTFVQVKDILEQAKAGEYVIFCFHGIPDLAHDWVSTSPEIFADVVKYLKKGRFEVISMGELTQRLHAGNR